MNSIVSVVVPFYNEVENLASQLFQIDSALSEVNAFEYECVFVDDGSTDGTTEELLKIALENPHVHPLFFQRNSGQSAALLAGMKAARGDYIVTLDGDLQNDAGDIPRIVELLKEYDCVCGYRAQRNDSLLRRFSSWVANKVRSGLLRDGLRDTGCGTKGFRKACVPHLPSFNGVHRYFGVFIRRAGFSIVECPVNHFRREHGVSKYGVHNRLWRGLYDLVGVAWLRRRSVTYELVERGMELERQVQRDKGA